MCSVTSGQINTPAYIASVSFPLIPLCHELFLTLVGLGLWVLAIYNRWKISLYACHLYTVNICLPVLAHTLDEHYCKFFLQKRKLGTSYFLFLHTTFGGQQCGAISSALPGPCMLFAYLLPAGWDRLHSLVASASCTRFKHAT